jgi:hypothetical protein
VTENHTNKLESVWIQRNTGNQFYEQINISGSDLLIYHSSSGELQADKISVFMAKYAPSATTSLSASWASSSLSTSYIAFDGNRPISRNDPNFFGINVGGNNMTDFLTNFFFPFLSATVAINSVGPYFEIGTSQNITINASVTVNQETIFGSGSILKDGLIVLNSATPTAGFSYADTGVTTYHSYIAKVQTDNNGSPTLIQSSTQTATFIYPYFYGTSTNPALSGTTLYTTLTKVVAPLGNPQLNSIAEVTATYLYFAFPATHADAIDALDPNLFHVLTAYNKTTVSVTSVGLVSNWTTNYTVYRWSTIANFKGTYTYTF